MQITKANRLARKAQEATEAKRRKHAMRPAYKGFLIATLAELDAWKARDPEDTAIAFWAEAASGEMRRQVAKLVDVPTETSRAAGKLTDREAELRTQAKAAALDAERARRGKRQWDAVDAEIEERLAAAHREIARLQAALDSALTDGAAARGAMQDDGDVYWPDAGLPEDDGFFCRVSE